MTVIDLQSFLHSLGIKTELRDDEYSCLCPFHSEKNPSFSINSSWPHLYNCFSCHSQGNIYTFTRELLGKSFSEVFGDVDTSLQSMFWRSKKDLNFNQPCCTGDVVVKKYGDFHALNHNSEALAYVKSRGITDDFVKFSKMYASKKAWINKSRVFNRILIDCYFEGKLVNVEARDYTGEDPRKVIYPWGLKKDYFFYNQDNITQDDYIVIVEGIMDLAKVWPVYKNVVSSFGSGYAKENRKKEILKSWGDKIVVIPDNDLAGVLSMENLYKLLDTEFWVAELKKSKDAGEADSIEIEKALVDKRKITDWLYDKKESHECDLSW